MKEQKVGSQLPGGYRVIDVLRGGMALVYVCHQKTPGKDYAIKTPNFEKLADDGDFRRLFEQEVKTWINISDKSKCPKIVRAHSFDEENSLLILEYVDGLSISQLARSRRPVRPVHPRHFLRWSRDIAEAMRELHSVFAVVHRDLKPQNILISTDLVAKVTDLGITKAVQENPRTATMIGTPAYMAPEILRGEVSYRSDIYSYGATLFWMLTCEHAVPLDGGLQRPLPSKIKRLLERCLQVDPQKRPGSFEQVLDDLEEIGESDFSWDESHYRLCETHEFFSPVPAPRWRKNGGQVPPEEETTRDEDQRCLLCEHHRHIEEQKTVVLSNVGRGSGNGETTAPMVDAALGEMPTADFTSPTSPARPRMRTKTAPSVTPPPPSRSLPRPPRRRAQKRLVILLAVVCVGIGGWFVWEKLRPGVVPPVTCADPDCDNPPAPQPSQTGEGWKPYCKKHSPRVCKNCGRRYTEEDAVDGVDILCECGAQYSIGDDPAE